MLNIFSNSHQSFQRPIHRFLYIFVGIIDAVFLFNNNQLSSPLAASCVVAGSPKNLLIFGVHFASGIVVNLSCYCCCPTLPLATHRHTKKAQTSSCLFAVRGLRIAHLIKQTTGNLRRYDYIPLP